MLFNIVVFVVIKNYEFAFFKLKTTVKTVLTEDNCVIRKKSFGKNQFAPQKKFPPKKMFPSPPTSPQKKCFAPPPLFTLIVIALNWFAPVKNGWLRNGQKKLNYL